MWFKGADTYSVCKFIEAKFRDLDGDRLYFDCIHEATKGGNDALSELYSNGLWLRPSQAARVANSSMLSRVGLKPYASVLEYLYLAAKHFLRDPDRRDSDDLLAVVNAADRGRIPGCDPYPTISYAPSFAGLRGALTSDQLKLLHGLRGHIAEVAGQTNQPHFVTAHQLLTDATVILPLPDAHDPWGEDPCAEES